MTNKRLDLNALEQPTLELTLLDDNKTTVHMTLPELGLIERLIAVAPELENIRKAQNAKDIKKLYDLAADLISNNEEGLKVTAEELRVKYKVRFLHLIFIFRNYLDLIKDLQNEKN